MRPLLLGVTALATTAAAGGLVLVLVLASASGPAAYVRPDTAHRPTFVRATRDLEPRALTARTAARPVVLSSAGQAIPGQGAPTDAPAEGQGGSSPSAQGRSPSEAPINGPNQAAARARLAVGDAAWSMSSPTAPGGAAPGATAAAVSPQALSPLGSPAGVGFPSSYARTPTWTPGTNGGVFGGASVTPSFAMSFGR